MTRFQYALFGALSLIISTAALAETSTKEREGLIALYQQTGGDNWINNTGWLDTAGTECSWFGIRCSDDGHIKRIALGNNGLKGQIPPELKKLSQLQSLRLAFNALTGSIPKEIGELTHLTSLTLNNNLLEGEIPKELGQLDLGILHLSYNNLSGEIPFEIGQIKKLNALGLDHNNLTGSVLDKFPNIEQYVRFQVHNNCLSIEESELSQLSAEALSIKGLDIKNQGQCDGLDNLPLLVSGNTLNIEIPAIRVGEVTYNVILKKINGKRNLTYPWIWKVSDVAVTRSDTTDLPASIDSQMNTLTFTKLYYRTTILQATIQRYQHPTDKEGVYFQYQP